MRRKRINMRGRADAIFNGRAKLGKEQKADVPFIWLWLDEFASGMVRLSGVPIGKSKSFPVKLKCGHLVHLAIGRPASDDRDQDYDFYVVDIIWPWELS